MILLADVERARERIAGQVLSTPVLAAGPIGDLDQVWFKLEFMQRTGTFKARGAFNRILAAKESGELVPDVGVVAASGGNAGLAHAFAAASLGVPATVFVPETAPQVKVERLRGYGATVVARGTEYMHAFEAAHTHANSTGALFCHAYDQPEIAAGAGTLALEMIEQIPSGIDTVIVAVGGGGLMAGVAAALEGRAQVIGVETESTPTWHEALRAGQPVDVAVSGIAADSLGARRIGDIAYSVGTRAGVRSVLVPDTAVADARRKLWDEWRIVVEPGAATALAALTSGAYVPAAGERVVVILCGANTSPADL